MIVAIHQPNYLPWPGYFYKIYASDIFILHDAVTFSRTSYTRRCSIREHKTSKEPIWLSVPLHHPVSGTLIQHVRISSARNWVAAHLRKIENTYAAAPFFATCFPWLQRLMVHAGSFPSLSDCNAFLIREIAAALSLKTDYHRSSDILISQKETDHNLALAKYFGATIYLAGTGSRKYQSVSGFHAAGIDVTVHDLGAWLAMHPYDQGTGTFTGGLSIIDALMHIGVEGVRDLINRFHLTTSL